MCPMSLHVPAAGWHPLLQHESVAERAPWNPTSGWRSPRIYLKLPIQTSIWEASCNKTRTLSQFDPFMHQRCLWDCTCWWSSSSDETENMLQWCLSSWCWGCWGVSTAVQTWTLFYSLLWLLWWVLRDYDIVSAAAALHQTDFLNVDFHAHVTTCKTKIIKHPSSTKNKCTQFHPQNSSLSCKSLAVKRMHPLSL